MMDGSDEPWGVLALGVAVFFALRGEREGLEPLRVMVSAVLLAVPAVAGTVMTPLIQALFIVSALAALVADWRCWLGHAGLFLLALPLISSLQFYGGYPLRWLIGKVSSGILNVLGFAVETQGTVMRWRGEMIVIDAPCSGVQMLWSAGFFACSLICIRKPDFKRSIGLLQLASFTAFAGNVLRNVLLFFLESGAVEAGEWAHGAVGVAVFCFVLAVIAWVACRMDVGGGRAYDRSSGFENRWWMRSAVFGFVCVLPFVHGTGGRAAKRFIEGPAQRTEIADTVGQRLVEEGWWPVRLDADVAEYAKRFPGSIELYEKEGRQLVARVIDRATRRYHMSADCYRAIGFATKPMPLFREVDGTTWGRVMATRGDQRVEVRERVVSMDGQAWTDPSSWFWSAFLGTSQGPWIGYSESVWLR